MCFFEFCYRTLFNVCTNSMFLSMFFRRRAVLSTATPTSRRLLIQELALSFHDPRRPAMHGERESETETETERDRERETEICREGWQWRGHPMRHDSAHRNTVRQHVSSALLCWAPGWTKAGPWWRPEVCSVELVRRNVEKETGLTPV